MDVVLKYWPVISTVLVILLALVLAWLATKFVPRSEYEKFKSEHGDAHDELDKRLNAGDVRFMGLEAAIQRVQLAAEEAKDAAEKAEDAAEKVHGVEVKIAELNGALDALEATLEPIKHFNRLMVEGHMKMGATSER